MVVAQDDDGRVTGVLPLFLHEWQGRRQLTLIGSGITDYLDPMFDDIDLGRAALHDWSDWDICVLQDLSANSALRVLGTAVADLPCSAICFEGSFDDFLRDRPKDLKRNLRRYKEKAEAIGPVTFEVSEEADAESLDALIQLHAARWQERGESGMIEANRSEGFLRDVACRLGRAGMLRFFKVRFCGRIAAIVMAMRNQSTIFCYMSAFDPEHERFGFGRELLAQAIRYAHENGYKRWDFLRGDEPYKFSWGAYAAAKCRVVIER